jgi:hypothetical protein
MSGTLRHPADHYIYLVSRAATDRRVSQQVYRAFRVQIGTVKSILPLPSGAYRAVGVRTWALLASWLVRIPLGQFGVGRAGVR